MNKVIIPTVVLLVFLLLGGSTANHTFAQKPSWSVIVDRVRVLETTRDELESLLGEYEMEESDSSAADDVEYRLRDATIYALYSQGFCTPSSTHGYNVQQDTIIEFTVEFRKPRPVSSFRLTSGPFDKREIEDVIGLFHYTNDAVGVRFAGSSTELTKLTLFPSVDQESLACSNLKATPKPESKL